MSTSKNNETCAPHSREASLLEYWSVIAKYWKMIVALVVAASIFAVVISLVIKNTYRAEAVIIPVSSKSGSGGMGALSSQFGGLASLVGVNIPSGANDLKKFMAILKSRTVAENVIERENLMPILFEDLWDKERGMWKVTDSKKMPNMEKAVRALRGMVTFVADKKLKTIKIYGVSRDPDLAARVVNVYVDELGKFISSNAFTMAKRNRIFIEGQLAQNKRDLLKAGKELTGFYRNNKISNVDALVDVMISSPALGESGQPDERSNSGVEIALLSPTQNQEIKADITTLLASTKDVEQKIAGANMIEDVPQQVYLTYLMMRRQLLAKVNALLTTQYEMAKIEEMKEDLAFQIIDKAVPPIRKYNPKRALICIMTFMASLFFAIFMAFAREYFCRLKRIDAMSTVMTK